MKRIKAMTKVRLARLLIAVVLLAYAVLVGLKQAHAVEQKIYMVMFFEKDMEKFEFQDMDICEQTTQAIINRHRDLDRETPRAVCFANYRVEK